MVIATRFPYIKKTIQLNCNSYKYDIEALKAIFLILPMSNFYILRLLIVPHKSKPGTVPKRVCAKSKELFRCAVGLHIVCTGNVYIN